MRKIFFLLGFILISFGTVQAQEIRLGAKAGVNLASVGGDSYGPYSGSFSNRTSFHIGAFVEIPLSEKFALQPEVLYSSEGAGWSVGLISVGDADLKLDYIRMPVMAKYYFIEGLSAELGPVLGVLVSADDKDAFNTIDLQAGIGVSYRFHFGLHAGLRYNKGLMNIYDTSVIKGQSNVFQVSVGYSF